MTPLHASVRHLYFAQLVARQDPDRPIAWSTLRTLFRIAQRQATNSIK